MITERYFERAGNKVLFRIAIDDTVVLDILTSDADLARCRELLEGPGAGRMEWFRLGSFGPFDVTVNRHEDGSSASFFIDGPDLDNAFAGNQTAGVYLSVDDLRAALAEP